MPRPWSPATAPVRSTSRQPQRRRPAVALRPPAGRGRHPRLGLQYELHAFNNKRLRSSSATTTRRSSARSWQATDRDAIAAGPLAGNVTLDEQLRLAADLVLQGTRRSDGRRSDGRRGGARGRRLGRGRRRHPREGRHPTRAGVLHHHPPVRVDTLALVASQIKAIGIQVNVNSWPSLPDFFGGWNEVPERHQLQPRPRQLRRRRVALHLAARSARRLQRLPLSRDPGSRAPQGQNVTRISLPDLDDGLRGGPRQRGLRASSATRCTRSRTSTARTQTRSSCRCTSATTSGWWPEVQNFTGNPSTASAVGTSAIGGSPSSDVESSPALRGAAGSPAAFLMPFAHGAGPGRG